MKRLALPPRLLRAQVAQWAQAFGMIWHAAPWHTGAWALLLVALGILPIATVFLAKLLVDALAGAVGIGGFEAHAESVMGYVALLAAALLLTELLQAATDWIAAAQAELVQDHIRGLVHRQAATLDLAFYESPEYHDRLEQARTEASGRPLALLSSVGGLVRDGITMMAMAAILLPYGPWLPLVLLASTLPAFGITAHFDRRYHEWWQRSTSDRRRANYYDTLLTQDWAVPESRSFGLAGRFLATYQAIRDRLRHERLSHIRRQSVAKLGASTLGALVLASAVAWMVWRVLHGAATLGDLALFYQAFQRGQGLMRSLLGSVGQIYNNTLFLENLLGYLALRPRVTDPAHPVPVPRTLKHGITFRNVTFRYPGSGQTALENFSLTIPANRIVALVGLNGAGKSTLVKLLCRLYDPEAGSIEVDGIDIRDMAVDDLRRLSTVLFQSPVGYHETAHQNVALGAGCGSASRAAVEIAARSAGAHEIVTRLPGGYDSQLGRWFLTGAELSDGQWQRLALARTYLKRAPIILLDEPTSYMDSWSEADWFDRLRGVAAGRTALVITHRFTIAMRADLIHVMEDGCVVESGRHDELLALEGLYAKSWASQMTAARLATEPLLPARSDLVHNGRA